MSLLTDVARRLAGMDLEVGVQALALAACVGDAALAAAQEGTAPSEPAEHPADGVVAAPVQLGDITVAGFRGIGPRTTLVLPDGNGLTLVVGANGSGKSSFAEAVEFTLTGDNTRWAKRSKVWRDGWRNLHTDVAPMVAADFTPTDGSPAFGVKRSWELEAKLDDHQVEVSDGEGLDERGWSEALDFYRPFLPYSELGAMVDEGPTALHDTLSAVLGLDVLTDGAKRLRADRLAREKAWKKVVAEAAALADRLATVDDSRAARVRELLIAKNPSPDAVAAFAAQKRPELDPAMDVLRVLVGLPGPDLDAVRKAADAVDDAAEMVRVSAGTDAARDLETAELLARAQRFHLHHGVADCPVCGEGTLDQAWADRVTQVEHDLRQGAGQVARATDVLVAARRLLAAVATDPPVVLHRTSMADIDASLATTTWEALRAARDIEDDRERAVQVRRAADAVSEALVDLRARAKAALAARTDHWAPHARVLADWVADAETARDNAASATSLKAAEAALNVVLDDVRAERWTPIADQAQQIWKTLGQGSSVAIADVALAGTGTRRRVEVQVTVDGIEGAALGVMSQGELHALALSLFLPRACLDESPFRFIVIDDPVQSMDSIRVDGLARVLQKVAKTRQVIVFTHDERLRDAVHRQGIPATVIEVSRGLQSVVELRRGLA